MLVARNSEFNSGFSLTPNFSWVSGLLLGRNRFSGFALRGCSKTVETVRTSALHKSPL
jgi:hypothetical protein